MKKILLLGFIGLIGFMGNSARAQFDDYGVKVAVGSATLSDDLSTSSPTVGFNVGGYINYTFKHSPTALAEIFYMQTGINLVHRGNVFFEKREKETTLVYREGHHSIWYAQLPILAGVHFELPIREPGHVVGFYLGPAVNYGVFGSYSDRMISPGNSSREDNYDVNFSGTEADRQLFNHIGRLDISGIFGLTYEYDKIALSVFVDRGFIAVSEGPDVMRILEGTTGTNTNTNTTNTTNLQDATISDGNNFAVMLSLSYKLGSFMK